MITAAVDGSSLSNPGPAGWAWYVDDTCWAAGGWAHGTNNMGELMAVQNLLEQTAGVAAEPLRVLCDSQYVINSVTKWMPGWKARGWRKADGKPVQNREYLEAIDALMVGRQISFEWVKGHAGHTMNEAADTRAHGAALAFQQGTPVAAGPGFPDAPPSANRGGHGAPKAPQPPQAEQGSLLEAVQVSTPPASDESGNHSGPGVTEVVALTKALLSDRVRSNPTRVRELLHPEFVEFGASGTIYSRARMIATIKPLDGKAEMESLGHRFLGPDTLLLRWRLRSGKTVSLRSSVWLRDEEGSWRLLFEQGTPSQ